MNTALSVCQNTFILDPPVCRKEKSGPGGLIRGRAGFMAISSSNSDGCKSLALALVRTCRKTKEGIFDTVDTIQKSLDIMAGMLSSMTVNKKKCWFQLLKTSRKCIGVGWLSDEKGLPFREAHEIVGKLVLKNTARQSYYPPEYPFERYQGVVAD